MTGAERIAAERERQVSAEGWSAEHDATHRKQELAIAAAVYAMPEPMRENTVLGRSLRHIFWPWGSHWWKPSPDDRVKELAKAGALIAAEIDRLAALGSQQTGGTKAAARSQGDTE